jgi:stearoyl-CoA 9-desaturase NADPH oxidoreductase
MRASIFASTWLRPLNDPALWRTLATWMNPDFRSHGIGARVVEIIHETADCKTFVLQTNRHWLGRRWPGHQAGQHTQLSVSINGRLLTRSFSISSAPSADGRIAITVKRNSHAMQRISVSAWLMDHCKLGDQFELSAPSGDFIVNNQEDNSLIMLSAGSGITPVMAMLRHRLSAHPKQLITFVHVCKQTSDLIFAKELQSLAQRFPALTLHLHFSEMQGRFNAAKLLASYPELLHAPLYLCGPRSFSSSVESALRKAGRLLEIQQESYGGVVLKHTKAGSEDVAVRLESTKQAFTFSAQTTLLEGLEGAGLNPTFGCRIGICKSCQCIKRSGVVRNHRTGELSDAPNEWIQLCVSTALSPLELAL